MPDRTVVDDWPELTAEEERAMFIYTPPGLLAQELEAEEEEPQSRAVVAVSSDRQWLVVLPPNPDHGPAYWRFIRWVSGENSYWEHDEYWRDTGQDAHEVLREFLEGRGG